MIFSLLLRIIALCTINLKIYCYYNVIIYRKQQQQETASILYIYIGVGTLHRHIKKTCKHTEFVKEVESKRN